MLPGRAFESEVRPAAELVLPSAAVLLEKKPRMEANFRRRFRLEAHVGHVLGLLPAGKLGGDGVRPWSVEFLGILPTYQLRVFRRGILPMVGWMRFNGRFRINWEVEKIVPVPLADFLKSERYAGCFFEPEDGVDNDVTLRPDAQPCFIYEDDGGREVLWGATYRIVMSFLSLVYGFEPPALEDRPVVRRTLSRAYLTGESRKGNNTE